MCMAVYIASDSPLPLISWNKNQRDFSVSELNKSSDQKVRVQFTKPYVYYVGSHLGCGCGFLEPYRKSLARLSAYLAEATKQYGEVELFAGWEGDQAEKPEIRGTITPKEIGADRFWFEEKQFLLVTP